MKNGTLTLVAASAMLASGLAVSASARQRSDYSTKETRALMHAYAKCVVRREGEKASEVLLRNVGNRTLLRKYDDLIVEDCLAREVVVDTKMTFGGDLYRYALADALVSSELADQPVPDLGSVPRLVHHPILPAPEPLPANAGKSARKRYQKAKEDHDESFAFGFLSRYGECVVRTNPEGAKALLLTVPDSREESSGFDALRAALATCLIEGRTLRFGRVALRGSIAINYYRLAHAARASAPAAALRAPMGAAG